MIDYSQQTGERRYRYVIETTFGRAGRAHPGFSNDYYDDDGWWALAWIAAYDLTGEAKYLDVARALFAGMAAGWDDVCGGGLWWTRRKDYKNAIPNELFLLIAARLHQRTLRYGGYLDWALREWRWLRASGLIGPAGLVNDGLTAGCVNNGGTTWTYNQGVVIGGLAVLHEITGDGAYLEQAAAIAAAALRDLTVPPGILAEPGEERTGPATATGRSSRASSCGTCTSSTCAAPGPNTATSSWPTRPRCGGTPRTGATRSGWPGPGRSTGLTRRASQRPSTRSTPRWVSPL